MTIYYRHTNSNNPMSDWGHAMFTENQEASEGYGRIEFTLDSAKTVSVYSLENTIRNVWEYSQENDDFGSMADEYYKKLSADEVFESFCPENIIVSAAGYDCDLVIWLWEKVCEPNGIMAIRTQDGAVCFDDTLIEKVTA